MNYDLSFTFHLLYNQPKRFSLNTVTLNRPSIFLANFSVLTEIYSLYVKEKSELMKMLHLLLSVMHLVKKMRSAYKINNAENAL